MKNGRWRSGFWLMVSGIVVLAAQAIFGLTQMFHDGEFSRLFGFALGSALLSLLISSIIVYFVLKTPKKASLFSVVWFSVAFVLGLAYLFTLGGLLGYALLVCGSLLIYQNSKIITAA